MLGECYDVCNYYIEWYKGLHEKHSFVLIIDFISIGAPIFSINNFIDFHKIIGIKYASNSIGVKHLIEQKMHHLLPNDWVICEIMSSNVPQFIGETKPQLWRLDNLEYFLDLVHNYPVYINLIFCVTYGVIRIYFTLQYQAPSTQYTPFSFYE